MENEKDVFRFEDFVDVDKLQKMKSELLKEGILNENEDDDFDDEEIDPSMNPYNVGKSESVDYDAVADSMRQSYGDAVMNNIEDFENSKEYSGTTDTAEYLDEFSSYMNNLAYGETEDETEDEDEDDNHFDFAHNESNDTEDYYKLYKDKAEDFTCDIAVEGVNQEDTEVRLIVESEEWTLMFVGEVKKGQCVIPMKKLSILNEGTKGTIRLEVNADGTLFTPWEDTFIVKASKKVTVKVNESRKTSNNNNKKPVTKKAPGVSVKVRK
jgi:hypothetical protein